MVIPKPILTTKVKCKECDGTNISDIYNYADFVEGESEEPRKCKSCKGKGSTTTEIYALRDFENKKRISPFGQKGYIIPFKDYEIKKVSEIQKEYFKWKGSYKFMELMVKHNLKEDDKIVITTSL